jgi:nicotinate-nucleotide adenylyltransferase
LRIGIFGGVFNPPHLGHLVCAQEAYVQLGLDVVVWVPVGVPSHRAIADDPGREARYRMCDFATSGDDRFGLSRIELDRPKPSFTVDTLRALAERAPDDERVLIVGGDEAAALGAWREPEEILRLAVVAAVERDGRRREEIAERLRSLEGGERMTFFDMPRIDVSSTEVRRRAAERLPIRYLVPDKVANYIGAKSLYGASTPVAAS